MRPGHHSPPQPSRAPTHSHCHNPGSEPSYPGEPEFTSPAPPPCPNVYQPTCRREPAFPSTSIPAGGTSTPTHMQPRPALGRGHLPDPSCRPCADPGEGQAGLELPHHRPLDVAPLVPPSSVPSRQPGRGAKPPRTHSRATPPLDALPGGQDLGGSLGRASWSPFADAWAFLTAKRTCESGFGRPAKPRPLKHRPAAWPGPPVPRPSGRDPRGRSPTSRSMFRPGPWQWAARRRARRREWPASAARHSLPDRS